MSTFYFQNPLGMLLFKGIFDRKIHTSAKLGISSTECENLLYFA